MSWQVMPEHIGELVGSEPMRAKRVMEAVMSMGKLDIATLKRAAEGR